MMDDSLYDLFSRASPAAAAMCTLSRQTWWRWKTGRQSVPLAVVNLLRIVVNGELPQGGPAWSGWTIVRGRLCDPANVEHTPGQITSWFFVAQQLQALRSHENQQTRELPPNVIELPSARPAHALTEELNRRLRVEP